eukprot:scaffold149035_cov47-Prasinocladus_malaysianus.AAC.2
MGCADNMTCCDHLGALADEVLCSKIGHSLLAGPPRLHGAAGRAAIPVVCVAVLACLVGVHIPVPAHNQARHDVLAKLARAGGPVVQDGRHPARHTSFVT